MESEVDRCLKLKDNDDATDELMSLSPYEMRNLLHHIMSGREFGINKRVQARLKISFETEEHQTLQFA